MRVHVSRLLITIRQRQTAGGKEDRDTGKRNRCRIAQRNPDLSREWNDLAETTDFNRVSSENKRANLGDLSRVPTRRATHRGRPSSTPVNLFTKILSWREEALRIGTGVVRRVGGSVRLIGNAGCVNAYESIVAERSQIIVDRSTERYAVNLATRLFINFSLFKFNKLYVEKHFLSPICQLINHVFNY